MTQLTEDDLREALHGAALPAIAVDARAARLAGRRRVVVRRTVGAGVTAGVAAALVAVLAGLVPGAVHDDGRNRPAAHPTPSVAARPDTPPLRNAFVTRYHGRLALDTGVTVAGNPLVVARDPDWPQGQDVHALYVDGPTPAGTHRPYESRLGTIYDTGDLATTPIGDEEGPDGRFVVWGILPEGASAPTPTYAHFGHGPRLFRSAPAPWDRKRLIVIAVVRSTEHHWPYEPSDGTPAIHPPVPRLTYTGADGHRHVFTQHGPIA